MCGISGLYQYETGAPAQRRLLEAMLDSIHHRGPDDFGIHVDGAMAFGMRRLSIIDLAGGQQPVFNEAGDIAVVFNGEIYNYRDLTSRLQRRGHRFATASDTEVIVHAYEEWGDQCVQHLRGMFGFAIWDSRKRRLLVARDRLGIKPLYYTQVNGTLVYGSEIKSILLHPAIEPQIDYTALGHYLRLKYVPAPLTLFKGIGSLPPGHLLVCDSNGVTIRRYWDLDFVDHHERPMREEEYAEELEALLRESVGLHLQSDVPFGAFLSGGLDSSLIVALMSDVLDQPVKTFSVGFAGGEGDELPYARQVAQQFGAEHYEVRASPDDFTNLAEKVVWHLDQPIADQALMATYLVSKLARTQVKMVLTGEGGDELFGGYARYVGEQFAPLMQAVPPAVRAIGPSLTRRLPGLRRPKIAIDALSRSSEAERFANWFPLFNREALVDVLSPALRNEVVTGATEYLIAAQLTRTRAKAPLHRMLYVDTKLWLADYLLLRGDKLTMAASIEARVPLLDHPLVEFAAALPPDVKVRGLVRKYLLKRVARSLLPDEIIDRKKQGFPIPIAAWFRNEARPFVRDLLAPETLERRGLLDPAYVTQLIDDHEAGLADHSVLLMGLLSLELWHRAFLDRPLRADLSAPPTVGACAPAGSAAGMGGTND